VRGIAENNEELAQFRGQSNPGSGVTYISESVTVNGLRADC
jgi:hypothetical protein